MTQEFLGTDSSCSIGVSQIFKCQTSSTSLEYLMSLNMHIIHTYSLVVYTSSLVYNMNIHNNKVQATR